MNKVTKQELTGILSALAHLSPIVRQLTDLRKGPEKDDYGWLKPVEDAFNRSFSLLVDAAIEANRQQGRIPAACVSTDSEGGVRIEWICPTASVHLVVPGAGGGEAYVYHEVGDDYATEDATPERLAYWLRQIN